MTASERIREARTTKNPATWTVEFFGSKGWDIAGENLSQQEAVDLLDRIFDHGTRLTFEPTMDMVGEAILESL